MISRKDTWPRCAATSSSGPRKAPRCCAAGWTAPATLPRCRRMSAQGDFVWPTVFADVDNRMRIAQEEIFGPVACLIPFEDEARRHPHRPMTSQYGLRSYVWTENIGRAHRVAVADRSRHVLCQQPERARPAPALWRHQGQRHRTRRRHLELRGVPAKPQNVAVSHGPPPHSPLGRLNHAPRTHQHDGAPWVKLALAAEDHPRTLSMYLSELDGPRKGTPARRAIDGHREIDARRCRELGVDTAGGVRHALAGQRQLPHQLRAALQGHLHQQRVAALHRRHAV